MILRNSLFEYGLSVSAQVDIGKRRSSNQDEVMMCQDTNFYAVSDGMGGLLNGAKTSEMIKQAMPDIMQNTLTEWQNNPSPDHAASLLAEKIRTLSDSIYYVGNNGLRFNYGATLSGVWLLGNHAIFINIGDSRGYILPRTQKSITQVTNDHNLAALWVQQGKITRQEARFHPASSSLTQFIGMNAPAAPETFIREVKPGDRILLCSDGVSGMIDEAVLPSVMRSARSPVQVCKQLIDMANANGGYDNIAVVYLKIENVQ